MPVCLYTNAVLDAITSSPLAVALLLFVTHSHSLATVPTTPHTPRSMPTLTDLPHELLEVVALNIYDPLQVTEDSLLRTSPSLQVW